MILVHIKISVHVLFTFHLPRRQYKLLSGNKLKNRLTNRLNDLLFTIIQHYVNKSYLLVGTQSILLIQLYQIIAG